MSNEELLRRVKKEACSCDPTLGWSCNFCKELLPELRQALKAGGTKRPHNTRPRTRRFDQLRFYRGRDDAQAGCSRREVSAPYLEGYASVGRERPGSPYEPKKLPRPKTPRLSEINTPYYAGRGRR